MKTDKRIVVGIIASLIMICSDCLLGYVDPTPAGSHFLLVKGYSEIALWRPVVSMILGTIGITLYLLPISTVFHAMETGKLRNAFVITLAVSLLGWLMVHFYYGYVVYSVRYLTMHGHEAVAYSSLAGIANAFMPFVVIYSAIMAASFGIYLVAVAKGQTALPRWSAALTPVPVAALLCVVVFFLPDSPITMALSMSAMNLSMLVWFGALAVIKLQKKKEPSR